MESLSRHVLLRFEVLWSGAEVLFIRFAVYQIQDVSYATVYRRLLEGLACLFRLPLRHSSQHYVGEPRRDSTHARFFP